MWITQAWPLSAMVWIYKKRFSRGTKWPTFSQKDRQTTPEGGSSALSVVPAPPFASCIVLTFALPQNVLKLQ